MSALKTYMIANETRLVIMLILTCLSFVTFAAPTNTSLLEAVTSGDMELVRSLIDAGADVNGIGEERKVTALHLAVEGSHDAMVQYFIDNGATVNTPPVWTPLHIAAFSGQRDIAKLLLNNGADVDAGVSTLTPTPLHVAVWAGKQNMVSLLLERGADINASDILLTTALHRASDGNQLAIAEQLIRAGANINSKGRWISPEESIYSNSSLAHNPAVRYKLRSMEKDEMTELAGSTEIGMNPPILKREFHTINVGTRFQLRGYMPTLVLPWSLGSFPEIEEMLGDGFGYAGRTPLDIAYEQDELAEMTMVLAAHGAQLASELSQQEEQ